MVAIPHKTYDLVVDNDWDETTYIVLYLHGTPASDVISFASWCASLSKTRLRVTFPRRGEALIKRARA